MFANPEFTYALGMISEEVESRGLCAVWLESLAALFGIDIAVSPAIPAEKVSEFAHDGGLGAKTYLEEKVIVFYRGNEPDETLLYLEALTKRSTL